MKTFLLLIIFTLATMNLFAQVDWVKYPGNPVIDSTMDLSSTSTYSPRVFYDGVSYHLWYTRKIGANKENLGYATSTNGTNWTLIDSLSLIPSTDNTRFDSKKLGQCSVIKENDTLKMWYWGHGPNIGNIGYAWSLDGRNWTRVDGGGMNKSVFDRTMDGTGALALIWPCVIKDGSTYRMWYTRLYYTTLIFYNIGYATSSDGITWTKVSGAGTNGSVLDKGTIGNFDESSVYYESVVRSGNEFQMWYSGIDNTDTARIGYATSTDGITWMKVNGNAAKNSCIDDGASPSVSVNGNSYKMWYSSSNLFKAFNYATSGEAVGVQPDIVPISFMLNQNYPNPFNPTTTIKYGMPTAGNVTLRIFDILGQEVKTLVDEFQFAGFKSVEWNANNLSSGIYFYRLTTKLEGKSFVEVKKLLLMK